VSGTRGEAGGFGDSTGIVRALYQKAMAQEERTKSSKSNFTANSCDVNSLIRLGRYLFSGRRTWRLLAVRCGVLRLKPRGSVDAPRNLFHMNIQGEPRSPESGFHRVRTIPALRWWIGGLLFASTVINYVDRQTLSLLAPYLKQDYHWTNTDYANLVIAFRVAYAIGQTLNGRLMDRIGTKRGLTLTVLWYSIVSVLTPLARGLYSFMGFRFFLALGESGNWPGATKAVSEWFPRQERGLATALFDSGSSIGGAIAPFIVLWLYFRWGTRPAFVVPGLLGFLWLIVWRRLYQPPQDHPRISAAERQMILADQKEDETPARTAPRWRDLLKLPQTWGTIIARSFTDPVWFFIADWFPIYLVAKGIALKSGLIAVWIPFIAADLGNFFSGWLSGRLIKRGWSVGNARKALVVFGGIGVALLIPTIFTVNLYLLTLLFGLATFSYASFTTIANVLPSDLYGKESVATVSGLSGTGAALGTIVVFELAGHLSDARLATGTHLFDPLMIIAGLIPFVGMILVLLLVRNTKATDEGLVRRI
jgi:ACS family hexuronate transporter-like MFS transporter